MPSTLDLRQGLWFVVDVLLCVVWVSEFRSSALGSPPFDLQSLLPSPLQLAFVSVSYASVSYHGNLNEPVRCRSDLLIFDLLPPPTAWSHSSLPSLRRWQLHQTINHSSDIYMTDIHVFSLCVLWMPVASFTSDEGICFPATLESNLPG